MEPGARTVNTTVGMAWDQLTAIFWLVPSGKLVVPDQNSPASQSVRAAAALRPDQN